MPILTKVTVLFLFTLLCFPVAAQEFDWASDFPVGATIPLLEAPDQNGKVQTLASLTGEKGLLLAFNRSFDWCPYCKVQLDGLQGAVADFEAAGFNVATLTYDPVDTLKLVAEDLGITFALLHDANVKHVNAFNILNTDYEPGHFAYGVPQPGIFLINPEGEILARFAEEDYRIRPDWSDVVAVARSL
jgi:peroxiredoxin